MTSLTALNDFKDIAQDSDKKAGTKLGPDGIQYNIDGPQQLEDQENSRANAEPAGPEPPKYPG